MDTSPGQQIRKARKARFWTQQDLAHYSGLSYKTISIAENDGGVKPKTLLTIGTTLGIDLFQEKEEVA